jgi:hypothetical protein
MAFPLEVLDNNLEEQRISAIFETVLTYNLKLRLDMRCRDASEP